MTQSAKRTKMTPLTIGTHNGHFHADEALAVHMLRMLPAYREASLVRTRDSARLAACDIVVDVGGEYDVGRRRFDHHQRTFDKVFPGRATKLSSAGLVFLHFGRAIIARRLGRDVEQDVAASEGLVVVDDDDDDDVGVLHRKVYADFVEALDAHDNGVDVYDASALSAAAIAPRFSQAGFTLASMVGRLNLEWNDPMVLSGSDASAVQKLEDEHFLSASRRIGDEFESELDYCLGSWLPARAVVRRAFENRFQHDEQGRLLVFDHHDLLSPPWKDHLFSLEGAAAAGAGAGAGAGAASGASPVLYVLYREKPSPEAKWRIQCVPESRDSFVSRKPLPEAWRGVRDEDLSGVTGIPGCVFVHASGFIGGNATWEGVREMAAKALAV
ncbi:MYG1 protein [Ophiocordyceps camponoti-floridani]|uniref:MYG1 protein n=1 Tax=Ophiocordyceps camponoti-floridani TaxID=2030778 RepID=A0A8H4QCR0_9HYPO|nr:MYG1 protein [Ophiocordyceps camponoti-floridani]